MNSYCCDFCWELERDLRRMEMELASFTRRRLEMSDPECEEALDLNRRAGAVMIDHQTCSALWRHHRIVHQGDKSLSAAVHVGLGAG